MSSATAVPLAPPVPHVPRVVVRDALRAARALIRDASRAPLAPSPQTTAVITTIASAIRSGALRPRGAAVCPWRPAHDVLSALLDVVRSDDPSVYALLLSERFACVRWLDAMEPPQRAHAVRRMRRVRDTIVMLCVTALCRNDDDLWPFLRAWVSPGCQDMLDHVEAARAEGRADPMHVWTERLRRTAQDDAGPRSIH